MNLRKFLALSLILVMSFGVVACSSGSPDEIFPEQLGAKLC